MATRTVTAPASNILVGTTDAQTLTNKTLTSPAISTPTGIVKGDVGLGNVDNTSDATKNAASATLTNKTLTTPTIGSFVNAAHGHTDAAGGGSLAASAIGSGVIATARLGSTGTADSTTFLRGDQSWATPAGGGSSDTILTGVLELEDHFISGSPSASNIGTMQWGYNNSTITAIAGEAGHPGIYRSTLAAATYAPMYTQAVTGWLCQEMFDITWVFRNSAVDSGCSIRVGLSGTSPTSSTQTTGIFVERITAETTFRYVTTTTRQDSAISHVATAWNEIRIRRIDATTIGFTINGNTEYTTSTGVPSDASNMIPFISHINADTTSRTLDVDAFYARITGL